MFGLMFPRRMFGAVLKVLFAKGAPEMLVKRCTKIMLPDGSVEALTDAWRVQIENELDKSLERGLRRLAGTRWLVGELERFHHGGGSRKWVD